MSKPLERDKPAAGAGSVLGRLYHLYLNGRFSSAIVIPNIEIYMNNIYHGAPYEVDDEQGEIHITATAEQLQEITRFRYRYYV
jgi:hypothetical protein